MQIKKKEIKFEQPSELLLIFNRYLILILFVLVVGVIISAYFFLLNPKIEAIGLVREQDIETEERRMQNERLVQRIQELAMEYRSIKENRVSDLERMKKILPNEPQIAELFVLADRLADEHSFILAAVNISDKGEAIFENSPEDEAAVQLDEGSLKSLAVNLNITRLLEEGEESENSGEEVYNDFKAYLDDLQKNLRLMDIQTISFGELSSSASLAGFSLDIITYYR